MLSRRTFLKSTARTAATLSLGSAAQMLGATERAAAEHSPANKFRVFLPTWKSLEKYQVPEWFRDAKFGIWAHWGPQCAPECGDWYARHMYSQGHPAIQATSSTVRPSIASWLQGRNPFVEGGEMGSGWRSLHSINALVPATSSPWPTTTTTSTCGIVAAPALEFGCDRT